MCSGNTVQRMHGVWCVEFACLSLNIACAACVLRRICASLLLLLVVQVQAHLKARPAYQLPRTMSTASWWLLA
jgi:energy-converting hydrogenase Eha subunit C